MDHLQAARTAISLGGIEEALPAAQTRLDMAVAEAHRTSGVVVACRRGCSHCCHLKVAARPYEVFAIADHLRRRLPDDRLLAVRAAVSRQAAARRAQDPGERMRTNHPCALLVDGACSVYAVRPARCRTYHSGSEEACEKAFRHPDDPRFELPMIPGILAAGAAASGGFATAVAAAGFDAAEYELSSALDEALADGVALKRFRKGKRAFLRALAEDAAD